jgi:hypothetical protein
MMPAVQSKADYRCRCRRDNDRRLEMNVNPILDWFLQGRDPYADSGGVTRDQGYDRSRVRQRAEGQALPVQYPQIFSSDGPM